MTRRLLAHGFAGGATAAAVLVTHLLWPKIQPGFFEFFLAGVILTAWWAGLGPALLATLLSVVAIDYYFVEPLHAVNLDVGNAIRLAVFAGVSLLTVTLTQAERRARARATAASRAKDRMLAVVSHDLRSPLNAVMGWAHLLRETVKEPIAVRAVEAIQRSAEAQRRLIEDLLDFVRIEAGALRLEPRDVDLGEVIRASVDSIRPAAGTKHIALDVSIDARASVVRADPARLQQATGNLLANALRFTPENGRVAVRVAREDGGVSIRVQDSGPGIPPDVLPHLFTALEETPARPGARGDGLGLGLAIARHIVELHGGTIEAANEPGNRGAFFMIVLPLGPRGRPTDPAA